MADKTPVNGHPLLAGKRPWTLYLAIAGIGAVVLLVVLTLFLLTRGN